MWWCGSITFGVCVCVCVRSVWRGMLDCSPAYLSLLEIAELFKDVYKIAAQIVEALNAKNRGDHSNIKREYVQNIVIDPYRYIVCN